MKQKRQLLHFQANNLLHVRKTHKTIHVTNRCMKQKMKQNRNLLHRSNSRTHVFFGAPWHSATVFKSASVRGLRGGSRDMARRGLWRASQIAVEGAAPLITAPLARTGGARGAGRDKCVAHGGSRRVDRSSQPRSHLRLARMRWLSKSCHKTS